MFEILELNGLSQLYESLFYIKLKGANTSWTFLLSTTHRTLPVEAESAPCQVFLEAGSVHDAVFC